MNANVSIGNQRVVSDLPPELQKAQAAIDLPEVQEMIRRLSEYNLGVYMPHLHVNENGGFAVLPKNVVQVESDLQVSFVSTEEAAKVVSVPVAWLWDDSGPVPAARCGATCTPGSRDDQHRTYHIVSDDKPS